MILLALAALWISTLAAAVLGIRYIFLATRSPGEWSAIDERERANAALAPTVRRSTAHRGAR